jgi:hypothetical protein
VKLDKMIAIAVKKSWSIATCPLLPNILIYSKVTQTRGIDKSIWSGKIIYGRASANIRQKIAFLKDVHCARCDDWIIADRYMPRKEMILNERFPVYIIGWSRLVEDDHCIIWNLLSEEGKILIKLVVHVGSYDCGSFHS